MLTFLLGLLAGWLITGTIDYFVTRRAIRQAHDQGVETALRQVSGW